MTTVYLLYSEVSDQNGTSELVGVFSTELKAQAAELICGRRRRTWIEPWDIDEDCCKPYKRVYTPAPVKWSMST